jgi:ATP-dependent RNA helicase DeaD
MTQAQITPNEPAKESAPAPTFDALPLAADVRKAIDELGYVNPTPVQVAVFEPATRSKNLVVQARTGTGKTAAFGLPIIDTLVKKSVGAVQALILTPTRELALQVASELEEIAKFRGTKIIAIYGGAPMGKQVTALQEGAQVVCGTPGRVLDHIRRGTLDTSNIRIFVLDEADEMLSMGFAKELNAIIETLPKDRQGLYFSATIPPDVERLANNHLRDPEYITLSSDQVGALEINHYVYLVREGAKREALARIIEVEDPESAIVFCNTKDETERVAEMLKQRGYDADWLNGDLEQRERERVMSATREGKIRFLVATDVAARGIDISHLTHVINADFPESAEHYVHRTGRTGRAGKTGTAISVVGPKDVCHL